MIEVLYHNVISKKNVTEQMWKEKLAPSQEKTSLK